MTLDKNTHSRLSSFDTDKAKKDWLVKASELYGWSKKDQSALLRDHKAKLSEEAKAKRAEDADAGLARYARSLPAGVLKHCLAQLEAGRPYVLLASSLDPETGEHSVTAKGLATLTQPRGGRNTRYAYTLDGRPCGKPGATLKKLAEGNDKHAAAAKATLAQGKADRAEVEAGSRKWARGLFKILEEEQPALFARFARRKLES